MNPLLHALAPWRQFIVVLIAWNEAKGKFEKFPARHSNGMVCNAHDATAWTDHATAAAAAARLGQQYGVGFVLTPNDPWWVLDIDGAATPQGWSPLSQQICAALPGALVEVSHSGTGLHLWGKRHPMPAHGSRNTPLHIELYSTLRFILLGRDDVAGALAEDCPAIDAVAAHFFPPKVDAGAAVPATGPRADWRGPTDDDELIRRALMSRSAAGVFSGGAHACFADLWTADERVLAAAFPPDNANDAYNRSSADAALFQHLAFWTGTDQERMRVIAERSALKRDKWEREDYVARTIANACRMQRDVLQDKLPEPPPVPTAPAPATPVGPPASSPTNETPGMRPVGGSTFLGPNEQLAHFAGCVYITDLHRVLVPGGQCLTPDRFNATYGGYTFVMDAQNSRTSRKAFEAFTESQVLRPPRADGTCFKPALPYGAIVRDAGRTRANTWWPVEVPCAPGDVTPFLRHLELLAPDPRDRLIITSYLACLVQYLGVKFQCALLIQGVEGNGKTFLSRCIAAALGARYVHWPKAAKIAKQFNSWMLGKLVYLVEDIYTSEHIDVIEELKPMVTGGDGLEIEAKGVDQVSAEVCGNFIINTNHKDGLRKTLNDRRWITHYCPQQQAADLFRDGMDSAYMNRLYDWAKAGGYAAITHFLRTFQIPDEFNFATKCQRAPITTSTNEAIERGLGRIEQEILEAVEQARQGFAEGWISSIALDKLLKDIRKDGAVPINRRRDLLRTLGYDWHPALTRGQTDNTVLPDGGRPRLFVRAGHPSLALTKPADVAKAYASAQQPK